MDKQTFLAQLRKGMSGLPQEDVEERLTFYSEMIDDRVEEGCTEAEAVAEIGPVEEVLAQIVADIPLTKLVKEKMKPKHTLKAWEIVLLVLGSPPVAVPAGQRRRHCRVVLWGCMVGDSFPVAGGERPDWFGAERRGSGYGVCLPGQCAGGDCRDWRGAGLRGPVDFPVLRLQGSDQGPFAAHRETDSDVEKLFRQKEAAA